MWTALNNDLIESIFLCILAANRMERAEDIQVILNFALVQKATLFTARRLFFDVVKPLTQHPFHVAYPFTVTFLDLSDKSLQDADMKVIADAMFKGALPRIEHLFMRSNQIGNGLSFLAEAMGNASLDNLESLHLSANQIGDAGIVTLAKAIIPSKNGKGPLVLKELLLEENQIGDVGVTALALAVEDGALPGLEILTLNSNQIGDAGMVAIAGAVSKGLPALTELELLDNPGDGTPVDDALSERNWIEV